MDLNSSKKIVLVSSGQPSLNPRLVKEADAFWLAGYDVTVLYAFWNEWGAAFDKDLLSDNKWKAIQVGGDPVGSPITFFISKAIFKLSHLITKTGITLFIEYALSRSSYFLIRKTKKIKADIYIGHNLGALPAVAKAAKLHHKHCGFDAEDFHRQEVSDDITSLHFKKCKFIEDRYFPQVDYLSFASPLIQQEYSKLYPYKKKLIINNVFGSDYPTSLSINRSSTIKLFWFSQTIGENRGIADVINALNLIHDHSFELNLLGAVSDDVRNSLNRLLSNQEHSIHFYSPINPNNIIEFSTRFDIGLALEPGFCLNNNIALSNKIFSYLNSGLAIVATNTLAQTNFMNTYPAVGKLYHSGDIQSLADILLYYHQNRNCLFETQKSSLKVAQDTLNWQNESQKLLNLIKEILK